MSIFEMVTIILLLVLILSMVWMLTEFSSLKKDLGEVNPVKIDPEMRKLRLQAYERAALLTERITLPNVLSRIPSAGLNARQMQQALSDEIKQEFDYNISQQIYLSPEIWKAITNMKEQNIYIVNQVGATLPAKANALDLNKQVVDFLINNPKTSIGEIVLEAINFEAKKLM